LRHKVEEVLSQDQTLLSIWRPVHAKFGRLKRLRCLIFYLSDDEAKKKEDEKSKRYEVLELIGHHPKIVALKGFYNHESISC
jgi:hypothetical protein